MERTLNRISVRLNVGLKDLTSKALAQFIVKILYSNDGSMSMNDIKRKLAKANGGKNINEDGLAEILRTLDNQGVKCRNLLCHRHRTDKWCYYYVTK